TALAEHDDPELGSGSYRVVDVTTAPRKRLFDCEPSYRRHELPPTVADHVRGLYPEDRVAAIFGQLAEQIAAVRLDDGGQARRWSEGPRGALTFQALRDLLERYPMEESWCVAIAESIRTGMVRAGLGVTYADASAWTDQCRRVVKEIDPKPEPIY